MNGCRKLRPLLLSLSFASAALAGEVRLDLRPVAAPRLAKAAARTAAVSARPAEELRLTRREAGLTRAAPLAVGDTVAVRLFDDVEIALALKRRTESVLGGESFLASSGRAHGLLDAVVRQTGEGLQIAVEGFGGRVYTVVSTPEATQVREADPKAGKTLPCAVGEVAAGTALPALAADVAAPAVVGMANGGAATAVEPPETTVDVLVAFDRNARAWAAANGGGITNFAEMAVQRMNVALANSGLGGDFRFRLVAVETLDAEMDDVNAAIAAIRGGRPVWRDLVGLQEARGADVGVVLVDTGTAFGSTGVGSSLESGNRLSFRDEAYSVCSVRSVAIGHTMTHEVGHNLGAGHATAVNPAYCEPGPQCYAYSAGHYFVGADKVPYHTVMAYNDDGWGNAYEPAPLFSSPDLAWAGTAAGDEAHDNARTLRENFALAAGWRARKVPLSYDVFFSPASGELFDDVLTVSLATGKAGVPIRYTLDGSAPTADSPLYDGPLRLTHTTTVRAVAVTDGVPGFPFEATYYRRDLGAGLDAPQLAWRTGEAHPWSFQVEHTYDGVDAVESDPNTARYAQAESWLETAVTGPTQMGFRYQKTEEFGTFRVLCDGEPLYEGVLTGDGETWRTALVDVPPGAHAVRFVYTSGFQYYPSRFNGVRLDDVSFDVLSAPPSLTPSSEEPFVFSGELAVTLTPPAGREGTLYYTLDGGDPCGAGAQAYAGPIVLRDSARVRGVFVEPGRAASPDVEGTFFERHAVRPGEWTSDVDGALAAAQANGGRLVLTVLDAHGTSASGDVFWRLTGEPAFLAWASARGVYLVRADTSVRCDAEAAEAHFWSVYRQTDMAASLGGGGYLMTAVLEDPARPGVPAADAALLMPGEGYRNRIGAVRYDETLASLVAGLASVLGDGAPPGPPVVTPDESLVDGYPVRVSLANTNASGVLYYTLDGTAPTAETGTAYAGPFEIAGPGVVLLAAVCDAAGRPGVPVQRCYASLSDVAGARDIVWARTCTRAGHGWFAEEGVLRAGGFNDYAYTAKLQGRVVGKGTLSFAYRVRSNSNKNKFVFSVGGKANLTLAFGGTDTEFAGERTVAVDATGLTLFEWTCEVNNAAYDFRPPICGVWLSDVRWEPVTAGTPVPVPVNWLRTALGRADLAVGPEAEALAAADADGDGYANWAEYLCGTDPTDGSPCGARAWPRCAIALRNGKPSVSHNIAIPEEARQAGWTVVQEGSADLRTWREDAPAPHYFRVGVRRR